MPASQGARLERSSRTAARRQAVATAIERIDSRFLEAGDAPKFDEFLTDPFLDRKEEFMTYRDAKTATARGQIQLRLAQRAAKAIGALQCLIVSADRQRGEMFERAASDGGWKSCTCSDVDKALAHLSRSFVHLAIVDLSGQELPAFRPLLEQLRSRSGVLLIVCGNEGDVSEEVWVRQLGAWLYLPNVTETSNLALLCGEARQIAERLIKPPVPNHPTVPAVEHGTYS